MAKHRKKKKTTHHRPRRARIGAVGGMNFNVMEMLESGAGLILGTSGAMMMQKYFTQVPQKVLSIAQLALGVANTQRPNLLIRSAAWGVAGAGALGLAHETGIMRGIDDVVSGMLNGGGHQEEIEYGGDKYNGMENDTVLSGMPNGTTLGDAGEDAAMSDRDYVPTMGYN